MLRLHPSEGFTPDPGFKVGECLMLASWGVFTFLFFVMTLRKNCCLMTVRGQAGGRLGGDQLAAAFFFRAWRSRGSAAAGCCASSPTRPRFSPAPGRQVFGSLAVTFWLLAGGVYSPVVSHAAGYVGAFCGLSAIYAAFAELYHENLGVRMPGLAPVKFI